MYVVLYYHNHSQQRNQDWSAGLRYGVAMNDTVFVIGASGRSGLALCQALAQCGAAFVPVVRDAAKWRSGGIAVAPRVADLTDPVSLSLALTGARRIVSCAHARHTAAILTASAPDAQLVLLGSTRRFTRWPDDHGNGVLAGEAALRGSGRVGVMLHPTMIYGAQGEDNVQRLAALLRRLPVVPLPGGGRALVQPIYQDDVTCCLLAAIAADWTAPEVIVIAGPRALPYADFVRAVAGAAGLARPRIVPVPGWLLRAGAPLTALAPRVPRIRADELRRLLEDKAFDIGPMVTRLRVQPRELSDGLARTFGRA